jgi:poly(A) polymerase Pap1
MMKIVWESVSPKRKGKQKKQHQQRTNNHHKQQQKASFYPRVEMFRSEEIQSTQLNHVLRRRGLYDSADGLRRRQETLEGLEELLNEWSSNRLDQYAADKNNSPQPRVALVSFGSYRLKIHKPGADMDLLAVCPSHCTRADFFTTLVPILKADHRIADVHPIPAAYTPVIKFTMECNCGAISYLLDSQSIPNFKIMSRERTMLLMTQI